MALAARYIAKDPKGAIDVTLIEPSRWYYTCFFSNLAIGDLVDFESTGHSYAALASEYGINVVHDMAIGVDRDTKSVTAASGMKFDYDRLILSPSIDFAPGSVNGWCLSDQDVLPHAYKGGTQAALFKAQVEAMPEGGTYVMVAPPRTLIAVRRNHMNGFRWSPIFSARRTQPRRPSSPIQSRNSRKWASSPKGGRIIIQA